MKNKYLLFCLFSFLFKLPIIAQYVVEYDIRFDQDHIQLGEEEELGLVFTLESLDLESIEALSLFVHVYDEVRTPTRQAIIDDRNTYLIDLLDAHDISIDRISYGSFPESYSVSDSMVKHIIKKDFVFLRIKYAEKTKVELDSNIAKVAHLESKSTIYHTTAFSNQKVYTLSNKESHKIKLRNNIVLQIPKNAFEYPDGSPVESTVKLKTALYLDVKSALANDLVTQTVDGRSLESAGMIDIRAYDKNNIALQLAKGKAIDVEMPAPDHVENPAEYELFDANETETGLTNWQLVSNQLSFSEKPKRRKLLWKKMNQAELRFWRNERHALIKEMREKGRRKIGKRLRRYKKIIQKRSKRIKERVGKYRFTRRDKDYTQLRRMAILGKAKKRWHVDSTYLAEQQFVFNFQIQDLGRKNIDRLIDLFVSDVKTNKIKVENKEGYQVRMIFMDYFMVLGADHKSEKAIFRNVFENQRTMIIGLKQIDGAGLELAYSIINTDQTKVSFDHKVKFESVDKALKHIEQLGKDHQPVQ